MNVVVSGCNHHNAPVEVRERLAFGPGEVERALDRWREVFPRAEAVVISTCNRVEVVASAEDDADCPGRREIAEFLAEFHGLSPESVFADLFERQGEDAVRHLFTVAASLDSMVLGEAQILSQVKQAYQIASLRQSAGPLSHSVFQRALYVAKRISTETTVQQKRVSIPSVAVADFAKQIFERFDDKRVLIIGAGEMGDETLRYLHDEGARDVVVVNRSYERAEQLAETWRGRAAPWSRLDDEIAQADVVVSTTAATEPIVDVARFRAIEPKRGGRALLILDLAIPRDFDPEIGRTFDEVYLYDVDALRDVCERNQRERRKELDSAMGIVEEETRRFLADLHHRNTGPVIRRLKDDWKGIQTAELERLFNKLPQLDEKSREAVRESFDRLVNKLLHPPLESLRDESRQGSATLLEALKKLFRLGE